MHPTLQSAARRRLGVFTVVEARRAGYRADEIRSAISSGRWHRLRRGIYIETAAWRSVADDPRARHLVECVAVLTALKPGPVVSHSSAARFHRFVLPGRIDGDVRLTQVEEWRQGRGYRIAAATLPANDLTSAPPLTVTSEARTLVDCAREWPLVDAVVAVDAALHAGQVTRAGLRSAVLAQTHWLGVGGAARAVDLSDGRAESPLESRGRLALVSGGLPRPELQVELHGVRGFVARVDAWYDDAAVALEFDGRVKYLDPRPGNTSGDVLWREKRREDLIRELDVRVVRIAQEDVDAPRTLMARVARLLATPWVGPRRFTVVRRPEPGADPADAVA
ncbi:Transcriptional regulator, AbiEi antitoxin, Type IV TA system [Geodermatophilus obscurus]|uniref:Transcriptional regulator, AbiEi antitoxin, Type IV TA system n=1 Tax=Geodermatophilus obscurus TaxID=1861 RepID=A0A1M7UG49_9ACTN|nr:type IV toxin-antitoxin system AbiEi family antitoxin domain-containing protein [Geodermatophilus obscurus]SHN81847.1 Transcriptional regulator, AbiEi antitoxin, Type IV TA system [Geodermatophilus obscurus]